MKSFIGYIKEFTYNTDKDWAVANFYVLDTEKIIKISGNINSLPIEVLYEIRTDENPEEKYNSEFYNCKSYKLFTASDNQIFFEYLKSDVFNKNIGDDFIKKLESYYQSDNIWQEILSNNEKFLNMKQVRKPVLNSVFNKLTFSNLKLEFLANDLDLNVLDKLIELYAGSFNRIQEAIKNSLYEINFQYKITSLESIDKIFLHFNKDANNVARITHYLHNYCNENLNNKSSSYTYLENIKEYFDDQEKFFIPVELKKKVINNVIRYAKNKKLLIIKKDRVYTAQTYNDEMTIASFLTNKNKVKKIRHSKFKQYIKEIQEETRKEPKKDNFKYDESQINALRKFIDNKFVVINGGPGTGKTTLIKGIVKLFKKVYPNESFKIATPTGRAAARIKESFEESDATTIHKLLQYDPSTGKFRKNIFNPLDEGLLIIDETSMVDNNLFSSFISSIGNAKRVVFVGDVEQLPSIGIGNAFEDIIKSKKITTVELKSTHRQGKQSKITDLAYMIRNNNFDITKLQETAEKSDLKTIFVDDQEKCLTKIIENYHFENKNDKNNNDSDITNQIQIISPFNKGTLGIEEINKKIQEKFNKNKNEDEKLNANGYSFYKNDKIMYLKNKNDLSNGDIGIINNIDKSESKMNTNFNKKEILLNSADLDNLTLCYACTVHKTQGSEFQKVILVLDPEKGSSFINKKLVYTAITRAKDELVIIASKQSFNKSINQRPAQRDTSLAKHIKIMHWKKKWSLFRKRQCCR